MKRILCLLLCGLLLTGCVTEQGEYIPTGDALLQEGEEITPTEAPVTDQFLVLSYYPTASLNPYTCNNYLNRVLFSLVYQGLFAVSADYQTVPILCSQLKVSPDMRTYTCYLANATFSDGSKVTAADVVASYEAARDKAVYKGRFSHLTEVAVSEDGGVRFSLDTAHENFAILLDVPIVKAEDVELDRPTGTGPYFYEENNAGLRLRRRETWWCNATLPVRASSIPLTQVNSVLETRDAFEFSDVGLACADPCSDSFVEYRCDYELWNCENGTFLYLGCNMESKVFSNAAIRSALTYAIDRQSLADTYYRGFALPASLPASPASPYYSPQLAARYTFDQAKFAQAISASGYIGMEIEFLVNADDTMRVRVARQIAQILTDSGLKVTMKEFSNRQYQENLLYGTYDLYLGQTRLSPNMDLSHFFRYYGNLRHGGMTDSAFYALCQQALANSGNYYNLHETVMDDGRLVPILFHNYSIHATRGLLPGLTPARDNVFYYDLGTTVQDILIEEQGGTQE